MNLNIRINRDITGEMWFGGWGMKKKHSNKSKDELSGSIRYFIFHVIRKQKII